MVQVVVSWEVPAVGVALPRGVYTQKQVNGALLLFICSQEEADIQHLSGHSLGQPTYVPEKKLQ